VKPGQGASRATRTVHPFNAQAFLDSSGIDRWRAEYRRNETIFAQGDLCDDILYLRTGGVALSVRSTTGHEAVVATLGPGDFFGDECLSGQPVRTRIATAIAPSVIVHIGKAKMIQLLHKQRAMSDRFIAHLLSRVVRLEESVIARRSEITNATPRHDSSRSASCPLREPSLPAR
jgi:CRP/FNR family transcriptional regulator, cyclic AMP receptor protein